tara:strand:- start:1881 stop:2039 length:159 start_codon:yes stop_codon:yes gene_type:complete
MPGFKNVGGPRFIGAGEMPQKKKGFPRKAKTKPYLQSWQDRNLKNRGTKLNK